MTTTTMTTTTTTMNAAASEVLGLDFVYIVVGPLECRVGLASRRRRTMWVVEVAAGLGLQPPLMIAAYCRKPEEVIPS